VRGHLNTLAQALENILRNAIRHSPEGGIVHLAGQRDGASGICGWRIRVAGWMKQDLERIFLPFTRLDGSRPGNGGFGLGLSIAQECGTASGRDALGAEHRERVADEYAVGGGGQCCAG
jgi:two-component system sensor histidine kinase PfeS